MTKYLFSFLVLAVISSCKEATIFGRFSNSEHGDEITVDCNYLIALPLHSEKVLPSQHDNTLSLNIKKTGDKEITLSVEADSIQWPFAVWNKTNETIEMSGRVYEKTETINCK